LPGQPGEVPAGGAAEDGAAPADALSPAAARALLVAGATVAAVAAAAYVTALATHPWKSLLNGFDLQVYLGGAQQALHHAANLYSWHYRHDLGIQFTYTPFAALVFAAGLAVPFQALMGLVSAAGTFGLAATVWIAFRELGWRSLPARAGATLLVTGLAFWTEPVQRALYLGQVELVMMAVIVWDMCQPDRRRWKGAAVGITAGIKLVPLLFIVYLLATRRFRQAYVACAAFAATVVIGFAALPHPSVTWWLKLNFLQAGRTGFVGDQQNQSLRGILTRLAGSVAAGQLPWLAVAILVALAGLAAAVVLYNSGRPYGAFAGLMTCSLTALLISPISWDHHWVWIAPGVALFFSLGVGANARPSRQAAPAGQSSQHRRGSRAARVGWLGLAGLVLVIYGAWPDFWRPAASLLQGGLINYAPAAVFAHGDNPAYPEYHWNGLQLLAGNLYLLGGLVLFAVALVVAARLLRAGGTALLRGPASTPEMPALSAGGDALLGGVDVHRLAAQEPHQGQPGLLGQLSGQRGRRGDGGEQRYPGQHRLLHQFERRPAADQQRVPGQRKPAREQRPPDHLVDRVVPADVLADGDQLTGRGEQPRGVQPAGTGEHPLRLTQPVRQRRQDRGGEPRLISGQRGLREHADVSDGRLAAHPARRGRHEVAPRARGNRHPRRELHVGDVADLVLVMVVMPAGGAIAQLDLGDVRRRRDDRLARQEACRELDVIAGRPHSHRQRGAVHPDAQRLLRREEVRPWRHRGRRRNGRDPAARRRACAAGRRVSGRERHPQHSPPRCTPGHGPRRLPIRPGYRMPGLPDYVRFAGDGAGGCPDSCRGGVAGTTGRSAGTPASAGAGGTKSGSSSAKASTTPR
jgi:alpha-1,2-mannosyltransferase